MSVLTQKKRLIPPVDHELFFSLCRTTRARASFAVEAIGEGPSARPTTSVDHLDSHALVIQPRRALSGSTPTTKTPEPPPRKYFTESVTPQSRASSSPRSNAEIWASRIAHSQKWLKRAAQLHFHEVTASMSRSTVNFTSPPLPTWVSISENYSAPFTSRPNAPLRARP